MPGQELCPARRYACPRALPGQELCLAKTYASRTQMVDPNGHPHVGWDPNGGPKFPRTQMWTQMVPKFCWHGTQMVDPNSRGPKCGPKSVDQNILRQGSRFEPTIWVHGNLGPQNLGPHVLGAAGIWGHSGFGSTRGTAHVNNPLPMIWFSRFEPGTCFGVAWAGGPHGFGAAGTLRVAPS